MAGGGGEAAVRNIKLRLAYDGAGYLGWQIQPQGPTIQSVLQGGLERITGERITVKGSGRTDAGVHALGQVANFHTASRIRAPDILRALNSVLPPSIVVLDAEEAPPSFDAQFSAVGKLYRYRVFNNRIRSPLELGRAWHVNRNLTIESMSDAASYLVGSRDFSSFRAAGCVARSPVRTLTRCSIARDGDLMVFELEADGFLRHMVRNIVGTLVGVGTGRFSTDEFAAIVEARDRTTGGRAAPPHGLYLVRVDYRQPHGPEGGRREEIRGTSGPEASASEGRAQENT